MNGTNEQILPRSMTGLGLPTGSTGSSAPSPSVSRQPRWIGVEAHIANVFAAIRQSTNGVAQFWQLWFGSRRYPNFVSQLQPLDAYSSGQPKMCPLSCVKTRSMLSGPQPSLLYCMTSLGFSAYAKCSIGY